METESQINEPKVFRLKAMVVVRMIAEVAVGICLVCLPVVLLVTHQMDGYTQATRMLIYAAAAAGLGLILIPGHGFCVHRVHVQLDGLKVVSCFGTKFVEWNHVLTLCLRSGWGTKRYVIRRQDGEEITFPFLMKDAALLIKEIRSRIPVRDLTARGGTRVYARHRIGVIAQVVEILANVVFLVACWYFCIGFWRQFQVHAPAGVGVFDIVLVVGFCLALTLAVFVRIFCLSIAPSKVTTDGTTLELDGIFLKRKLAMSEVQGVLQPFFFLPDGLLVKTQKEWLFLDEHLDSIDELQEELWQKVGRLPGSK